MALGEARRKLAAGLHEQADRAHAVYGDPPQRGERFSTLDVIRILAAGTPARWG